MISQRIEVHNVIINPLWKSRAVNVREKFGILLRITCTNASVKFYAELSILT